MATNDGSVLYGVELNKISHGSSIIGMCNSLKLERTIASILNFGDYMVEPFTPFTDSVDLTNTTCPVDNKLSLPSTATTNNLMRCAFNCRVYDNFETGSVEATKWTTSGTVTESTGAMRISASSSATSDGSSPLDLKSFAADSEVVIILNASRSGSATLNIRLSGDGTPVILYNYAGSNAAYYYDVVRIAIDYSTEEAYVKAGEGNWSAAIDISGVGTNWYINFNNQTASTSMVIAGIGYIENGASGTVDMVTEANTFGSTKTAGVLTYVYDDGSNDADIVGYLSADGTNFTSCTKSTWTNLANTGTSGKIKLTMTLPTTVVADGSTENIKPLWLAGAYFDD